MSHQEAALAKARAKARLRRGMFLLPSLFTMGNIAAGFFSITQTMAAIAGTVRAASCSARDPPTLPAVEHNTRPDNSAGCRRYSS